MPNAGSRYAAGVSFCIVLYRLIGCRVIDQLRFVLPLLQGRLNLNHEFLGALNLVTTHEPFNYNYKDQISRLSLLCVARTWVVNILPLCCQPYYWLICCSLHINFHNASNFSMPPLLVDGWVSSPLLESVFTVFVVPKYKAKDFAKVAYRVLPSI